MKLIGWKYNFLPKGEGVKVFYFLFIPVYKKQFCHSTSLWE